MVTLCDCYHAWGFSGSLWKKCCTQYFRLVGVIPTPLKNIKVNWDDNIPNVWRNEKCSKPPTSRGFQPSSWEWEKLSSTVANPECPVFLSTVLSLVNHAKNHICWMPKVSHIRTSVNFKHSGKWHSKSTCPMGSISFLPHAVFVSFSSKGSRGPWVIVS